VVEKTDDWYPVRGYAGNGRKNPVSSPPIEIWYHKDRMKNTEK